MSLIRSDLWASAFVRRHNDLGHVCVLVRRGDPLAGQIFVEVDHLNGTASLYVPAPAVAREDDVSRIFQLRFDRVESAKVEERIAREIKFDPDLWVVTLELRSGDPGLEVTA
jgi:hypothetical protein